MVMLCMRLRPAFRFAIVYLNSIPFSVSVWARRLASEKEDGLMLAWEHRGWSLPAMDVMSKRNEVRKIYMLHSGSVVPGVGSVRLLS